MSSGCFNAAMLTASPLFQYLSLFGHGHFANPLIVQGHPRNSTMLKLAGKGGFVALGGQVANNGF